MKKEVKELNSLIEHISQKVVDRNINEKYLMSRMAVIVNEFDPVTNTASIIIPTDLNNSTNYKYPNRTGINKLNSTVWENGQIKTYGDKVYLIYQTNNISQGWLESNKSLKLESSNLPNLEQLKSALDLDNVENKSASDILGELEDSHISEALGYTPYDASNPDGYTTNTGTVTSVVAGTGLTGDTITSSGTIALDTTRAVSVADINTGVNNDNKLISARTISEVLSGVENQIAQIGNGAPIVVSTAASMIDTTKTYLYMGNEVGYYNGDWYYYDGTNWVAGGSYGGSTVDSALSPTSVNPVQNKAVTTRINDVYDELDGNVNTINSTIQGILISMAGKIDGARVENNCLYLTSGGEDVVGPLGPFGDGSGGGGGGGGGGGNNAVISVANTSGWLSKTISDAERCVISFTWSSEEDGISTGQGTLTLRVNGTTKLTRSIEQGNVSLDITRYLSSGDNIVRVTISDVYGNSRTLSFSVSLVSFTLTSTFDDSLAHEGNVIFSYVATGATTKRMQFILDGTVIGSLDVTTSGRQQNFTIPAQSHGAHSFECYFTAEVNGSTVESNHLYYDIIFTVSGNTTPIISSSLSTRSVNQYYTLTIPYTVYTPNAMTSDVTLLENGVVVQTLTVDRTKQSWVYRAYNEGAVTLAIRSGATTKSFNITVIESEVDVEAETNALALYLSPNGRSNSERNPATWVYNTTSCSFKGFDWSSNGWVTDDDGYSVLRLTGNARVTIPYKIFGEDFRTTGKTIEFDFATSDVADAAAQIISCLDGTRGLYFTPTSCYLASEQISLDANYKEEEHTRISFVIEKRAENRLVYIYINGIISGIVQYPSDDNFQQVNAADIVLGSNYCTLDIYAIRVYDNSLTRYQILDNWIADTVDGYTLLQRYNHNNIYNEYGNIVISNLPNDLPYLVIESSSLPQYKGDKKTVSGYYVDPLNSSKSFSFANAQIDVQGTSSQFYARKNYKIKFNGGFNMTESGETISKYQMRATSIPTKTFCFKADVASSEGANNVELARLYNDICPYKTAPQVENNDIRQGIDGFPIVVFWTDLVNERTSFLGKYNFNNDKGTEEVFGFDTGDESWEIRNNVSNRVLWKSADYTGTGWQDDFEARYPEDNTVITNLANMAAWLVTTDRDAATDEALAESVTYDEVTYTTDSADYRLAKFKAEVENYWEVQDLVFYYLFTEIFLMVDSRGKNMFPTLYDGDAWALLPYDFDTAIGIDNNGKLAFGWSLEDVDQTAGGANVYNAQNSVLWVNTRDAFGSQIKAMYQSLRSQGLLSYQIVENRFAEHQAIWPEAIFNEDAYFKYIAPLTNPDDGNAADGSYLVMCQGSKASQRQWWLYNRFKYLDSKYETGEAISKTLYFKTNAVGDVTVTPFDDVYVRALFGQAVLGPIRGTKDVSYTFTSPLDTANDTEVAVYSADYIKDIGDFSGLKVSLAHVADATRLQSLKLGDDDAEYENGNLTDLQVGANRLLRTIDCSNCTNLVSPVDLSQCKNLETVKFGGTGITGITLPNGGNLRTLVLPNTITNLTIKNQPSLQTLTIPSYSQITTLNLEGIKSSYALPIENILKELPTGARLRVIDYIFYPEILRMDDWGHDTSYGPGLATDGKLNFATYIKNYLNKCTGIDSSGSINMEFAQTNLSLVVPYIKYSVYQELKERYPSLRVFTTRMWNGLSEEIPYTASGNVITFDYDGSIPAGFSCIPFGATTSPTTPKISMIALDENGETIATLASGQNYCMPWVNTRIPYNTKKIRMNFYSAGITSPSNSKLKVFKGQEYTGPNDNGRAYTGTDIWDYNWDYSQGLLSENGWTNATGTQAGATGTETMESNGVKLTITQNGNAARYVSLSHTDTTITKGVIEIEFTQTAIYGSVRPDLFNFQVNLSNGSEGVSVLSNSQFLYLKCNSTGASDLRCIAIHDALVTNTRYTLTIVMDENLFEVYLNHKLLIESSYFNPTLTTHAYIKQQYGGTTIIHSVKMKHNRVD